MSCATVIIVNHTLNWIGQGGSQRHKMAKKSDDQQYIPLMKQNSLSLPNKSNINATTQSNTTTTNNKNMDVVTTPCNSLLNSPSTKSNTNPNPNPNIPKTKARRKDELLAIGKAMSLSKKKLTFGRLFSQTKNDRKYIVGGTLFTFLIGIIVLLFPILIGSIITSISESDDEYSINNLDKPVLFFCLYLSPFGCDNSKKLLYTSVLICVFLAILQGICAFFKWLLLDIAGERLVTRIRKRLFYSIMKQEIGMFDICNTGELCNRVSTDTSVLKTAVTKQLAISLNSVLSILLSMLYIFYLSWQLSVLLLFTLPLGLYIGKKFGRYYRKLSKINQDYLAASNQIVTESVLMVRTIKIFSNEKYQTLLFNKQINKTYKQGIKMALANAGFRFFFIVASKGSITIVLFYGSILVMKGEMNAGSLLTYVILTISMGFRFSSLLDLYTSIMKALGATERVFELIDRQPAINAFEGIKGSNLIDISIDNINGREKNGNNENNENNVDNTGTIEKNSNVDSSNDDGGDGGVGDIRGEIRMLNVSFSYPSRPSVLVLNNLTLDVMPGKITALVGESGGMYYDSII